MATSDSPFAPNVGMIRKQIQEICRPQGMSETEALSRIMRGLERSIYHSQEEFDKLLPILQKVVGSPSQKAWASMDAETVQSVVGPALMCSYRSIKAQQEAFDRLPSATKDFISGLADRLAMPASEDNTQSPPWQKHLLLFIHNGLQLWIFIRYNGETYHNYLVFACLYQVNLVYCRTFGKLKK